MNKINTLLRTKLRLPFIRSELVLRQRLKKQIQQGLLRPLTLVIAPAGFGKTTLIASSIITCGLPVAWISLDREDNRPDRFLSYIIEAFRELDPRIGNEATQLMTGSHQMISELVLTSLINDLDVLGNEIILVLDDYHLINNQDVHEAVSFILEYCPRNFHLVIASRSNPPLPIPRMLARGQAIELRTSDLSFDEVETAEFLNGVMGLGLDTDSVMTLAQRTEGWIVGLQMAGLSLRDRSNISEFIDNFSGTNRYILDYLLEEVLMAQTSDTQRFLLYTSILERLSPSLCDAVLAVNEESPSEESDHSATFLQLLERQNLFVIPLDNERNWYRYHHLFNDLLQARLKQILTDDEIRDLHIRAARWYEAHEMTYEAIYHASLTSDNEWVERLIEQNYTEMMQRGESLSIRFWTGMLSKELVYRRPLLCIHEAMSRAWFGQLDEAEEFLVQAKKQLQLQELSPATNFMRGYIAYVESRIVGMRGDIHTAIEFAHIAREHISADNVALQGGIGVMLGYAYFLNGDFGNANHILNETIESGIAAGAINTTVGAFCVLARLYAIQGQLHRSQETYQEAANFINNEAGQHLGAMSIVNVGIAEILLERNELGRATTVMKRGLETIQYWSKADDIVLAYTVYSQILTAQGRVSSATDMINKATQLVRSSGVFPEAQCAVLTAHVRSQLKQGIIPSDQQWIKAVEAITDPDNSFGFKHELERMTLARVYMVQDKLHNALDLLNYIENTAETYGRTGRLIEALILKALVLQQLRQTQKSLTTLEKCLTLAEPEQYTRVFLDEGQSVQMLLAQWLANHDTHSMRAYVIHLLSEFKGEKNISAPMPTNYPNSSLSEPLSQRELEVLHIMALGKTNQQIAQQLVIARGTVKAHTASIYRKLDVTNRTEAIARARELGILP